MTVSLPIHPRLIEHGMTRDPKSGQLCGSLRAGAELLLLTIERMTPEQKAQVRAKLREGRL
jgi:hypothetical protein